MSNTYTTRAFHALAHDFRIVSQSREVGEYLEELLAAFPEVDGSVSEYRIRIDGNADAPDRRFVLELDDELVVNEASVGTLSRNFVQALNRRAISADYAVMCHAGGVELDGVGFVLPADPESGKTTLTAGLVRAGFAYLTDEAVAFDPSSRLIEPFPKPLSIDAGAHFLFPELEPAPAPGDDAAPEEQWQIPPDAIRPGAVGRPCAARFILFPSYEQDAATELEELSAATTLVELATNTFEFRDHPRHSLEVLAGVVEGARGFRLVVGDLHEACALVTELAELAGARGSRRA
jgi:hypothetical protein